MKACLYNKEDYVSIDGVLDSSNVYVECGHSDDGLPYNSVSVGISRREGWRMLRELLLVLLKGTFKGGA